MGFMFEVTMKLTMRMMAMRSNVANVMMLAMAKSSVSFQAKTWVVKVSS